MRIILPAALLLFLVGIVLTVNPKPQLIEANADNGGNEAFLASIENSSGEWEETSETPIFENQQVAQLPSVPQESITNEVLAATHAADGSEKWIEVDISDQKLFAWEGNRKVYEFPVSTGRPGYDTVKGEFRVWRKVKLQRYRGGVPGTSSYYNLPNVPYSLFFYKGYAIHGAYWHNDFGIKRRSSGCVNLHPDNARLVYEWAAPSMPDGVNALNSSAANPGTRIVVHD